MTLPAPGVVMVSPPASMAQATGASPGVSGLPGAGSILDHVTRWDLQADWGPLYGVRTFETRTGVVGAVFESKDLLFFYELHSVTGLKNPPGRIRIEYFLRKLQKIYPMIVTWKIHDKGAGIMLWNLGFRRASVRAEDGQWAGGVVWTR